MRWLQKTGHAVAGFIGRESPLIQRLRPAYETLLDIASLGRGIPWLINGVVYRIDPRQRQRLGPDYDRPVAAYLRERVRPGSLCFDVGANVGVYVLQFAHWSQPNGQIIAFEPNPAACQILRRHIRLNNLESRVRVIQSAVGCVPGQAMFFAADADGMSRLGKPNSLIADRAREVIVPLITLDQFCQQEDLWPDWLVIDVEGFELQVLQGATRLLQKRKPGIIVEMHPSLWPSADANRSHIESFLEDFGLDAIPLLGQNDPLGEHGSVSLVPRNNHEANN